MRGLYAGFPPVKGARCRMVLSLEEDFPPHLVETLLGFFGGIRALDGRVLPSATPSPTAP